jgi:hypothetical protein
MGLLISQSRRARTGPRVERNPDDMQILDAGQVRRLLGDLDRLRLRVLLHKVADRVNRGVEVARGLVEIYGRKGGVAAGRSWFRISH